MNNHSATISFTKASYRLTLVRQLVKEGRVEITGKARKTADNDFSWQEENILRAFKRLQTKDFYKTEPKYDSLGGIMVDYYKAMDMMGERVYTHFRIENRDDVQHLVICSFKRI